jgi:hypothetical protein
MSVKRTLGLSRRSLLRGAATAGAAGLAVTALAAGPAEAETTRQPRVPEDDGRPAEPITVHIRDHRSGVIDVFWGTHQTRLHDRELARRIAGSIR